jgi:hypothetical protein
MNLYDGDRSQIPIDAFCAHDAGDLSQPLQSDLPRCKFNCGELEIFAHKGMELKGTKYRGAKVKMKIERELLWMEQKSRGVLISFFEARPGISCYLGIS